MSVADGELTPEQEAELDALYAQDGPEETQEHAPVKNNVRPLPGVTIHRDDRPVIDVSWELHRQCNAAIRALAQHDPGIYHRDGQLVHVVKLGRIESTPERPCGTPEIRVLTASALAARLSAVARWIRIYHRKDGPEEKAMFPPAAVSRALCDFGQWTGIRRLEGIIETPTFRPDGTIIDEPGWDSTTGLLYAPSSDYPPIPEHPTREDACAAYLALREPFEDFPYANAAHIAVPIAAILTILARPAILGSVPAFLFDASDRGAGKSLQVQCLARIVFGRWSRPRSFPAKEGRVNEEELAKVLGAVALGGRPLLDFDNVRCVVDGAPLLAALTTIEEQEFRVLGESRDALMIWRAVVCMGGNNLAIGDEMARRSLLARCEPPDEHHERRADLPHEKGGYRHARLREWVASNRARLVVAALTLLRAWFAAKRPRMGSGTKASFEEWSDIIPHVILWAGGPDVTLCLPSTEEADEDPGKAALRALIAIWHRLEGPDGMTCRQLVDYLYPDGKRPLPGGPPDAALDAAREAVEEITSHRMGDKAPSSRLLGNRLMRFKGTKLQGKCLRPSGKTGGSVRWKLYLAGTQ